MIQLMLNNGKLKAMALLFAVLSWFVINQITSYDRVIPGVMLTLNLPEGWAVKDRSVSEFEVHFRGTQEELRLLDERYISINVDLRDEEYSGTMVLALTEKDVSHASNARILSVEPSSVEITFDQEGEKRVPINLNIQGELQLGIQVESAKADPQLVTVTGSKNLLEGITSLQTAPIDLSGRIQSFEQRVDVLPPGDEWSGKVSPASVLVKVTLVGTQTQRTLTGLPVQIMSVSTNALPAVLRSQPSVVDVFLQGRPELLETLAPERVRAYVLPQAGDSMQEVSVHVPPGVEVLEVQPASVRLSPMEEQPATGALPSVP